MRIILVGKAASGKDFFRDFMALTEPIDVSYTTRPQRVGETPGYTYNFISDSEFIEREEDDFFLEAVVFNSWRYGTSRESWENNILFIMTPSGIKHIPIQDRSECVIVYFDIPEDVRRKRLMKRSDADSVERRILADDKDFKDFTDFDIRVSNPFFDPKWLHAIIMTYSNIK